jgi:hypothetical protein
MGSRLLIAALLAVPAWANDAPERPRVSMAEAEAMGRKLDSIRQIGVTPKGKKPSRSMTVTEGELNSYLNLTYATKLPSGLSDVAVSFDMERIHARGQLDLDRVRDKMPPQSPWSPLALLRGRVPVEVTGRFTSHDGMGHFEPEEAWVSSVPIPISLFDQIVSSATKTAADPDGVNINEPFRLPYALKAIRLVVARAYLDWN